MVIVHDTEMSRIPWETMQVGKKFPAVVGGISRRYTAEDLAIAKWLEQRRLGKTLELLLVVNPTRNLFGAERRETKYFSRRCKVLTCGSQLVLRPI